MYLPSWWLHGDTTLTAPALAFPNGDYPAFTGIRRWPGTNRWVNPHPMGEAILMTPFFAGAHILTRWSHFAPDGFSFYYQHAAGLAGLVYLLAGLSILRRTLMRHFSAPVALAALLTVTFGTNLFHYGVYDSVFSHVYSFFLVSALLAVTEAWWEKPTLVRSVAAGLVASAIFLTRHTNVVFLLMIPLYGVHGVTTWRVLLERVSALAQRWRPLVTIGFIAVIGALPQLLVYRAATGSLLPSPYAALGADAGFAFHLPRLFDVLFSPAKGVFFWSPALLLAVAGWVVARGWAESFLWPVAMAMTTNAVLFASWVDWQLGGSYGHRGFTDGFGLVAVFIAAFFAWTAERRWLVVAVSVVTLLCVALSVAQMIQYWLGVLPIANTTWEQDRALFLTFQ